MTAISCLKIRRETVTWALLFIAWIGINLMIFYGPALWNVFFDPVPHVSWWVRRQYLSREWGDPNLEQAGKRPLKYRVLEPPRSESPQPLLLFLHGAGHCGGDNTRQLLGLPSQLTQTSWRRRCPGFVLVPQCPADSNWQRELTSLVSLVESWRNDPRVDQRRIYVTGYSMGGYGTWHIISAKPDWFAGAVPICGGGDPDSASKLIDIPIWAVHGSEDKVIPQDQSRQMIEAIKAAGGDPKYTELPGVGHNCWTQTYQVPNGILAWLYQQVKR